VGRDALHVSRDEVRRLRRGVDPLVDAQRTTASPAGGSGWRRCR
jgi:hypothetical protein